MKISIKKTNLKEIYKLKYSKYNDIRGSFQRLFCKKNLRKLKFNLKQINLSKNLKAKTFRGFHYQSKFSEKKIIIVLKGEIIFYAININKKSKDYKKKIKIKISEKDNFSIYVSNNFAVAYLTIKNNSEILYLMGNYYAPKYSQGINFKDPKFKIRLPCTPKVISKKDKNLNFLI